MPRSGALRAEAEGLRPRAELSNLSCARTASTPSTIRSNCARLLPCRKVEPLQRALAGKKAWITGMRAQQSATRDGLPVRAVRRRQRAGEVQSARRLERKGSLGLHQARTGCRTTRCTTSSTPHRLRPVHAPVTPARMFAPAAGGGKTPTKNAGCTSSAPELATRSES